MVELVVKAFQLGISGSEEFKVCTFEKFIASRIAY